ncbi:MAG: guanylate kinase [Lachnospiraceae bacterium]|nr:guanylate kinase [Lachnospiraceae bacterium]MDY5742508.1 guanylate kinase [Lachnospiraceae bacterium]
MKKGLLIVISGFSGAGKGTVIKKLLSQHPDQYALSVSATTRAPREGEQEGRSYFFVTKEQFEDMIRQEQLIEYASYVKHYYGTPLAYVDAQRAAGRDVILEIEIQGALLVKQRFPDAVLIFLTPPSAKELERRLVSRGTESPDVIASRLARAVEEAEYMKAYDHLIINDRLEDCVSDLHQLIQAKKTAVCRNLDVIQTMQRELTRFKAE